MERWLGAPYNTGVMMIESVCIAVGIPCRCNEKERTKRENECIVLNATR